MSKYEDKIALLLWKDNISCVREKTFSDLKGGRYRYDFYLPKLNAIIECNGEQHYYIVWGGRQQFLKQQEHDRQKISYALANGIKIYCIPYWELSSLKTGQDLFQNKFLAQSKWKNDLDWKDYQKNIPKFR